MRCAVGDAEPQDELVVRTPGIQTVRCFAEDGSAGPSFEVDVVAAEDTRHTRVLLAHLGLSKPIVSYYDAVESKKAPELVARAEAGERSLRIRDAGSYFFPHFYWYNNLCIFH